MEQVWSRAEIERKSSYMMDRDGDSFAFLKYVDRIEIWEQCDDMLYRLAGIDKDAELNDVIRKKLI